MAGRFLIFLWMCVMAAAGAVSAGSGEDGTEQAVEKREWVEILAFFLKSAEDAQMPTTPIAVDFYNRAAEQFQNNEFDLARESVRNALKYDHLNGLGYELLGDIENREGNLGEAKANYEIAMNIQGNPRVRQKLEKLQGEIKVEKNLKTYREEHFVIKYHDEVVSYEGFELRELLRTTYRAISSDFAYYFKHKVVVLLYDEGDFRRITQNHRAAGLFDGKVRMPANSRGFDATELRAVIRHEVTHAFVAAMGGLQVPPWLNEGLAEFEENRVRPVDLTVFDSAVATGTLPSLDQLMSQKTVANIRDQIRLMLFYQQSFRLVQYLNDRYGMFRVKELLAEIKKGQDSDGAVRNVLKISIPRLEKEWKQTIIPT